MYQYPMMPFGYPPNPNDDRQKVLEKGMQIAERLLQREAREKERHKKLERRAKEEEAKQAAARAARRLMFVETYILGIVSYPLWAPLYSAFKHYLETMH